MESLRKQLLLLLFSPTRSNCCPNEVPVQNSSSQLLTNIQRAGDLANSSSKTPLSPQNSGQHAEFPSREVGVVNKAQA